MTVACMTASGRKETALDREIRRVSHGMQEMHRLMAEACFIERPTSAPMRGLSGLLVKKPKGKGTGKGGGRRC